MAIVIPHNHISAMLREKNRALLKNRRDALFYDISCMKQKINYFQVIRFFESYFYSYNPMVAKM